MTLRSLAILTLVLVSSLVTSLAGGCASHGETYATPEAAAADLVAALRPYEPAKLNRVLGPDAVSMIDSGDQVDDKANAEAFLEKYDERRGFEPKADGSTVLVVGNDAWPFPIPLVRDGGGWRWDLERGAEEIENRRIGRNELDVIEICRAFADAQREYHGMFGGYAQYALSDPGQRNGLYWATSPGEPPSPLGPMAAEAEARGYNVAGGRPAGPRPFHGYYFRILGEQGKNAPGGAMSYAKGSKWDGFAIVAWPVEYGSSGIKSFMISHHGILFENDLGEDSDRIARGMKAFDPDPSWKVVAEESK